MSLMDFVAPLVPRRYRRVDMRRFAPWFVIMLFIMVTIPHEASYAGSFEQEQWRIVGWPYAVAINLSIPITEYFTRWSTTRRWAWVAFFAVVSGSGALNVAYIQPWNTAGIDAVFAWIYALLPTAIITFLGFLSSQVGKLASSQEKRWETQAEKQVVVCFCGEEKPNERSYNAHLKVHVNEVRSAKREGKSLPEVIKLFREKYPAVDIEQVTKWFSRE